MGNCLNMTYGEAWEVANLLNEKLKSLGKEASFCIVNRSGEVILHAMMDKAIIHTANIAKMKAQQCAAIGIATSDFSSVLKLGKLSLENYNWSKEKCVFIAGGVPIFSKEGILLGGLGVSNLSEEEDDSVATDVVNKLGYITRSDFQIKVEDEKLFVSEKKEGQLTGLAHIGLFVADIKRSKEFYVTVLGFEVAFETEILHFNGVMKICFLRLGNLLIEAIQIPDSESYCDGLINHIAIQVRNIEAVMLNLAGKGIIFEEKSITYSSAVWENGSRWILFRGPDNERLELNEVL